ncbi:MAG: quinone-dependent dihydroorotate dehydrogenase [Pyrinomonadaceae bacterium]|nr:quinone-dependent dihydroorotate dehydrogenase [Pyrinomonadaceae bacterium]
MSFYNTFVRPLLFSLPAETAHNFALSSIRTFLRPSFIQNVLSKRLCVDLAVERFGLKFKNPLGLAAGFDKNCVAAAQLACLGFGFVEIGTVTYKPQSGSPKPRLFRLEADKALINRMGFNNDGAEVVVSRLKKIKNRDFILGVNIGKNREIEEIEAVENYLSCFRLIREEADYVAINVSSPNTPNLRKFQEADKLRKLLKSMQEENTTCIPILVKISPDLSEAQIEAIVEVCLETKIHGVIATNTTVSREGLQTASYKIQKAGEGGLSGKPLAEVSNQVIRKVYRLSQGKLPIIGVGGIFTAEDAFKKICAGASLLQVYTGFVYMGPAVARDINLGLQKIIHQKGFASLDEAVGSESI